MRARRYLRGYLVILALFAALELVLELGAYDRFLKPRSYAGQATAARRRLDALAAASNLPRIVAIGSSRIGEALDELVINEGAPEDAPKFLNLGLERAGLPEETAVARYLAALDPVTPEVFVLEVDFRSLLSSTVRDYDVSLIAPFNPLWKNTAEMIRTFSPALNVSSLGLGLRLVAYRADIRDALLHPRSRLAAAVERIRNPVRVRRGNRDAGNVCELWSASAAECAARSREMAAQTHRKGWQSTSMICGGYVEGPFTPLADESAAALANWKRLLEFLQRRGRRVVLLYLPQSTVDLRQLPPGSLDMVRAVSRSFQDAGLADFLDFSELLRQGRECEWFGDPFHVNRQGAVLVSEKLREELARMFRQS